MKRNHLFIVTICLLLLTGLATQSIAAPLRQTISALLQQSTLLINGEKHEAQSLNYQNTTYVPLRKIAELLGTNVHWDQKTGTIKITDPSAIPPTDNPQDPAPPTEPTQPSEPPAPGYAFQMYISPEMELMAGVLTQTSWIRQRGPNGIGNEYFRALQEFMYPYRNHRAVQLAEQMVSRGFMYDAPCAFICHLGSLPDLPIVYNYNDRVLSTGGGRQQVENLRLALVDLARESLFTDFIAKWQPKFDSWVAEKQFDSQTTIKWLEDFTGGTASEFHLIFSPAMFPGGGYSVSIDHPDGSLLSYQIIREFGRSTGQPEFHDGDSLMDLSLHEWGHSLANPAIDAHPALIKELQPLFEPVADEMQRQAYGNVTFFMYEHLVRGMTSLAVEELQGKRAAESHIRGHEQQSFYLTRQIMDILKQYQAERHKYPKIADFIPTLVARLKDANLIKSPQADFDLGVFPGHFKNIDYSRPSVFLTNGDQTKSNSEIRTIATQFNNKKDLSTLREIFRWTQQNLQYGPGEKFGRTSAEIIRTRIATGCTDYGLAFATLAREKGIPTVFLQTARIDWIHHLLAGSPQANMIQGHILVEVFVDGDWHLLDSTAGKLFLDYDKSNLSLCDGYYTFAKSIEVWDSGVLDERENSQVMWTLFRGFNPALYQNPKYDYIDLLSGARKSSSDFIFERPGTGSGTGQVHTVVLGLKEPVELFSPKFNLGGRSVARASVTGIGENTFRAASTIVLLCADSGDSSLNSMPSYMADFFPELNTPGAITLSQQKDGKRVVIVKAPTLERLMKVIEQLPSDILKKDYR